MRSSSEPTATLPSSLRRTKLQEKSKKKAEKILDDEDNMYWIQCPNLRESKTIFGYRPVDILHTPRMSSYDPYKLPCRRVLPNSSSGKPPSQHPLSNPLPPLYFFLTHPSASKPLYLVRSHRGDSPAVFLFEFGHILTEIH